MLGGPEGGGGAAGQEVPRHGDPGALGPHRTHAHPAAEESKGKSMSCPHQPMKINESYVRVLDGSWRKTSSCLASSRGGSWKEIEGVLHKCVFEGNNV